MEKEEQKGLEIFEKYLTLWVALCMVTGVFNWEIFASYPSNFR